MVPPIGITPITPESAKNLTDSELDILIKEKQSRMANILSKNELSDDLNKISESENIADALNMLNTLLTKYANKKPLKWSKDLEAINALKGSSPVKLSEHLKIHEEVYNNVFSAKNEDIVDKVKEHVIGLEKHILKYEEKEKIIDSYTNNMKDIYIRNFNKKVNSGNNNLFDDDPSYLINQLISFSFDLFGFVAFLDDAKKSSDLQDCINQHPNVRRIIDNISINEVKNSTRVIEYDNNNKLHINRLIISIVKLAYSYGIKDLDCFIYRYDVNKVLNS